LPEEELMMTVTERVAYLKGLCEGMDLGEDSKEGKVLVAILDVLDELATTVTDLEEQTAELSDDLDDLFEEVSAIEEDFIDEDALDDQFGDDLYQVICPTCGETIYLDEESLEEGTTVCPTCGEELEFELDPEEEE
jgi:formylmethanofuran dehydrogenase subunit E